VARPDHATNTPRIVVGDVAAQLGFLRQVFDASGSVELPAG
jgi:hypothetical protein